MELSYAEPDEAKRFQCATCPELNKKRRKCESEGFENVPVGSRVNNINGKLFRFCPGKATWYPEIIELFQQCELAAETGIMPDRGAFLDQDATFADVFPTFVSLRSEKKYIRQMKDLQTILVRLLEAAFGGKGKHGRNQNHINRNQR